MNPSVGVRTEPEERVYRGLSFGPEKTRLPPRLRRAAVNLPPLSCRAPAADEWHGLQSVAERPACTRFN